MREIGERGSLGRVLAGFALVSGASLLAPGETALAAPARTGAAARSQATASRNKAVNPEVMKAFEKMGAFLRAQTSLHLVAETTTDQIDDSGQKLQFSAVVDLFARRPDRLRVDIASDRMHRELFYDGKTFTQYAPEVGFYASFEAPPTIAELIDQLQERYGIDLPLEDLFYWGSDKVDLSEIRAATDVGPSQVSGFDCEHFAFRQKDVDWQVWLAKGPEPLPLKLVVTTTSQRAQPEHVAVLKWDLATKAPDATYHFVPPPTAHQIEIERVE